MKLLSGATFVLILHASFCVPSLLAASTKSSAPPAIPAATPVWQSMQAEHIYGFPEIKHNKKGTLSLSTDALTFSAKSEKVSIPRASITAVSAGNQRVELWGMSGRILRMTIPDGGGLAAATVMHHRVDMLTVEFNGVDGGTHAAVFFLPANEADHALQKFALSPVPSTQELRRACRNAPIEPNSILVSAPNWDHDHVPAAYRALVYEHLIDRLRAAKDVSHVYREGEHNSQQGCPQYTINTAITAFKEGSSVKRSFMGPVGMFVGTTQMKFDVTFDDASGKLQNTEQIAATMRGDSESTNVADHVAKNIAKHYTKLLKQADKNAPANKTGNSTL